MRARAASARVRVRAAPRGPEDTKDPVDPRVETGPVKPIKLFRSLLSGQNKKARAQLASEAQ